MAQEPGATIGTEVEVAGVAGDPEQNAPVQGAGASAGVAAAPNDSPSMNASRFESVAPP